MQVVHTKLTPSRAARERISAQETVALQDASSWVFMASMISYPRTEFALGPAFFSPVNVDVSSNRIEASHPFRKQNGNRSIYEQEYLHSNPLEFEKKRKEKELNILVLTWTKQSWKKRRRMEAPIRGSLATAWVMTDRTMVCTFGHVFL